jgi:hypothetical protein
MNKLELAIELIKTFISKNGEMPDVKIIFESIDKIESEAISRRLIQPDICPRCQSDVKFYDLSSGGEKQYRIQCDCKDVIGKNLTEAIKKWLQ